jgi:hypothetical protein
MHTRLYVNFTVDNAHTQNEILIHIIISEMPTCFE